MKSNLISKIVVAWSIAFAFTPMAHSENNVNSSRTEIFDNPFFVIAENPQTKLITGYLAALRTAPDRTDACKVFFQGVDGGKGTINISLQDAEPTANMEGIGFLRVNSGLLRREKENYVVSIKTSDVPGNCDWILEFLGEPSVVKRENYLDISIEAKKSGDWTAVRVAKSKRAYFHTTPDIKTKSKSFVIAGDLLYVYKENVDWYFVKYDGAKKQTSGWIRKEDILEIMKP
jgi:hypothetical protein